MDNREAIMKHKKAKKMSKEIKAARCTLHKQHIRAWLWVVFMLPVSMLPGVGCSMESDEYSSENYYLAEDPGASFELDMMKAPMVRAFELEPDLPSCEEALADPSLETGELFNLYRIVEVPELGLLTTEDEQICVCEYMVLQLWLTTGKWYLPDYAIHNDVSSSGEDLVPTTYESEGKQNVTGNPVYSAASSPLDTEKKGISNVMFVHDGSSTNINTNGSASSDPVEDSNPLPPRINPL